MRLGYLSFGKKMTNIGDAVQALGVRNIYEDLGINVLELPRLFAYSRNAEKQPIAYISMGYLDSWYKRGMYPLASNLFPFYLGTHCVDEKRYIQIEEKGAPVFFGCRDIPTFDRVNRFFPETKVFMTGCFSLIQKRRKKSPINGHPIFVDVIPELRPFIPHSIDQNHEEYSHIHTSFGDDDYSADKSAQEFVIDWLSYLKNNASLVVTSRLHCALPCVAMGIPVIVARRFRDDTERYRGYEKLFRVYMPDEFAQIDWSPEVEDLEWYKKKVSDNVRVLIDMIKNDAINNKDLKEYAGLWKPIHEYFYNSPYTPWFGGVSMGYLLRREKEYYYNHKADYDGLIAYITRKNPAETNLIIWGAGDRGQNMLHRYEREIGKYKGFWFIDSNKNLYGKKLFDTVVRPLDSIKNVRKNTIVIVAVDKYYEASGRSIAKELSERYHYIEGDDFLMLDKLDASACLEMEDFVLPVPLM